MKQKQYAPLSVAEMAVSLYAVNNGFMDKVDKKKVVEFEAALLSFARSNHGKLLEAINAKPVLKEHEASLKKIVEDFVATGAY
jgi:F-type H+-transporting ATPase subunit alpha